MAQKIKQTVLLSMSALLLTTSALAYVGVDPQTQASTTNNEALLKQISKGFSKVAKSASPAVVYIENQGTLQEKSELNTRKTPSENPFEYFSEDIFRFFGFPFESKSLPKQAETVRGSGFLVSQDGYIVTNNHVVDKAKKLVVTLSNGKKMTARLIGTDTKTDLAVIKIEGSGYPFLSFGDSDALEVGDWAIAIGNPFGLQTTVTVGVVSAKGRSQLHIADFEDFIQTDAPINPGNSGGPLLGVEGEVIGVNTAIVSGSGGFMGIGFAIPSTMAKRIVDQLITSGQVVRGFLGVSLQAIDPELAGYYKLRSGQGILVTDVVAGSPAETGGLKQEDVIISYNNMPIDNLSSFRNHVALLAPGTKIKLRIVRDGKEIDLYLTVSQTPDEISNPSSPTQKLGLHVQELTSELAQKFGYADQKHVVITQVTPGSPAAEASLRSGNLIIAVNRQKITNLTEFNSAINAASKEGRVVLKIQQGDMIRFIALRFE